MIIKVAGFNIDIESIIENQTGTQTPETIAASYAKISRDPRQIGDIRKDAREDVKSARELNKRVVFDMGHSSIAEHGIFNIDIIGISRLASEYVEHFRLASYTEKSQRYIKLNEDFLVPEEFNSETRELFVHFVKDSFSLYEKIYNKILPEIESEKRYKDEILKKRDIEGLAMEDARYVLPLCVTTQIGLTANARNIEYMIKILSSSPLSEVKEISKRIFEETIKYAPSLIRYTEPDEYFSKYWFCGFGAGANFNKSENYLPENDGVNLLSTNGNLENILSLMVYQNSKNNFADIEREIKDKSEAEKTQMLFELYRILNKHNQLPRFFESIELEYELIMSASCYAQFKRHRMMTQIVQDYDMSLGFEMPPLLRKSGFEKEVFEHYKRAYELYRKIRDKYFYLSNYVILNGNRRRVYAKLNARELYHISRLRMDHHAQWEILRLANRMVEEAKKRIPYVFDLCSGKDEFEEVKRRVIR